MPGPNRRGNAKCPGCGSLERHRLLWLYLENELNISTSKIKLLNIAPDYAIQTKLRKVKNVDYTSIDLESPIADQRSDITKLYFSNSIFDAVICYHVLEHIEEDIKALAEIYRVLKPGGWAILQSPIDFDREHTFEDFSITSPEERERIFGQRDHVRIYGKDYTSRLQNTGFVVKEDKFINRFTPLEISKYVLDKDEIIFFCTKPGK
jgi:SAM-dependent methyltransferase